MFAVFHAVVTTTEVNLFAVTLRLDAHIAPLVRSGIPLRTYDGLRKRVYVRVDFS